jgi:2-amino-4-hydroxy-6-hydroxymethyldihydropteridine diphosphokinase
LGQLETKPWGFESDSLFLNQAVLLETKLQPLDLLDTIQRIEKAVGRVKQSQQWSSRIIDIDVLCSEARIHFDDRLIIPHKWLHKRDFALRPLSELVPNWKHPLLKQSYKKLFINLEKEEAHGLKVRL